MKYKDYSPEQRKIFFIALFIGLGIMIGGSFLIIGFIMLPLHDMMYDIIFYDELTSFLDEKYGLGFVAMYHFGGMIGIFLTWIMVCPYIYKPLVKKYLRHHKDSGIMF